MKNSLTDIKLYFCINKVILKELLDDKLLYCYMVFSMALKFLRKLDKKSLSRRVGVI